MAFVSLTFVKDALRVSGSYDDVVLTGYIEAASERIAMYLKDAADQSWTEETAPPAVRIAVTIVVDALYSPGKADILSGLASNDPRNPLVGLLYSMRMPSLA
jgi:hypothetical protein